MEDEKSLTTMVITVIVALIITGAVLVPIVSGLSNGGGNGGGGGGSDNVVSVPAGLVNSAYIGGATFMSDDLGFEAITDTDITDTFPTLTTPIIGDDTNVAFGRCEAYLVDDTSNATLYGGSQYRAILSYSIYSGEWSIDASSNGIWDVGSWALDTTGHITLTYPNGKGNDMPYTYKVEWLWYDSETSNYHDMGGMIAGLEANNADAGETYSLINKGQYIGIFTGGFYDTDYGQEVPITYMGQIGDDWTIDIEYDVYDSVSDQVYHQEKTVSLEDTGGDLSIPIITNVLDEETGLAVVQSNSYRGVFTVSQTVDGPGGFRPLTISYQEIYNTIVDDEWDNDYLGLFELEDGLIDGKIYSYTIAKVGDPRYIMEWDENDGYIVTPAGTFTRDDFILTFDNGYGMLKWGEVPYVWVFDSDIQFYGDTTITWYDADSFTRGTFDATFFPSVGQPPIQQSNVENYVSVGTFTVNPNGEYLMVNPAEDDVYIAGFIQPSSWLKISDDDYPYYQYLYLANNGEMIYTYEPSKRDTVESYYHTICPWNSEIEDTGAVVSLSNVNGKYVIPMTLGYYTYDPDYDAENDTISITTQPSNASAENNEGGGMVGAIMSVIPVFVVLAILMYAVTYLRKPEY